MPKAVITKTIVQTLDEEGRVLTEKITTVEERDTDTDRKPIGFTIEA